MKSISRDTDSRGEFIRMKLKSNFVPFVAAERTRISMLGRGFKYDLVQLCAHIIAHCTKYTNDLKLIEADPFFAKMRVKPKGDRVIVHFAVGASDKRSRDTANDWAKCIRTLFNEGKKPDEIAEQLANRGGISGVLDLLSENAASTKEKRAAPHRAGHRDDADSEQTDSERSDNDDGASDDESDDADGGEWEDSESDEASSGDEGDSDHDLDGIKDKLPPVPPDYFPLIVFARNSHREALLTEGKVAFTVVVSDSGHEWLEVKMVGKPRPRS